MEMNRYLNAHQQDFMQEDTQAGMIYAYLEDYTGDRVCSKQLYEEALGNLNSPADWETRAICEIMNTGIAGGIIQGWAATKARSGIRNTVLKKAGSVSTKTRRRGTVFRKSRKKKPGKWNCHSEKPPVDSLVDALVDSQLTEKSLIFGAFLSFVNHVNQEIKEKVKSNNRAPMDCFQSLFCRLTRFG